MQKTVMDPVRPLVKNLWFNHCKICTDENVQVFSDEVWEILFNIWCFIILLSGKNWQVREDGGWERVKSFLFECVVFKTLNNSKGIRAVNFRRYLSILESSMPLRSLTESEITLRSHQCMGSSICSRGLHWGPGPSDVSLSNLSS